jgi:sulfur-carrier protein
VKTIRVRYYAFLRESRGQAEEAVKTDASSAGVLYDELRARHSLRLGRKHVRAAVNGEILGWQAALNEGDTVAFFPPVAGG